ncbi:MAG: hypothetical protein KBA03_00575 [Anaerolineaceae bacterium]|nr:hypothetical protein [Anaerolineaceae bacterium]
MKTKARLVLFSLSALLILSILSGCALSFQNKNSVNPSQKHFIPDKLHEPDLVEVQFAVKPQNILSDKDAIVLELLDLGEGTKNKAEDYPLNLVEGNFVTSLFLPEGASIAYRYRLVQPVGAPELLSDGTPLPFRQLLVRENLKISDIIAGWSEHDYHGALVDLNGVVADDKTEEPIPDILVNVAGKTALTDMNGRFYIRGLPEGLHNLLATSNDGSYLTFQQEVNMVETLSTMAIVRMQAAKAVTLTFVANQPEGSPQLPVRIAGNLRQFGLTFQDMLNGNGAQPVNMPTLIKNEDGQDVSQIKVYAGSYLRYQYTSGDANINSERDEQGKSYVREFIVPDEDTIVNDTIASWHTEQNGEISFSVKAPEDTPSEDRLFIQFKQNEWSNPLPMNKTGENLWEFIFYPRIGSEDPIEYRYCRNANCLNGLEEGETARSFLVGSLTEKADEISGWANWEPESWVDNSQLSLNFDDELLRGLELDPQYLSENINATLDLIDKMKAAGFNTLILTPVWNVYSYKNLPIIDSDPSNTIPSYELNRIAALAHSNGLKIVLYPQLENPTDMENWWENSQKTELWWQQWYAEYERMVMHSVKLATRIQAEQLILGGPAVVNSYPGKLETVSDNFGTPKTSGETWSNLLKKTDDYYQGELLLARSVDNDFIETYEFDEHVQGFYLLIDSQSLSSEEAEWVLDSTIANFQNSQNKAVYLALKTTDMDLEWQYDYYYAYLNPISYRGWIAGVSSRGFNPSIQTTDFSSSIYGKPAWNLFSQPNKGELKN